MFSHKLISIICHIFNYNNGFIESNAFIFFVKGNKKQRMDKPAVVDGGNVNGDKEDNDEDECLFDSDTSLPEIPDAPSTPVENRKFSAEQIFKNNLVLLC